MSPLSRTQATKLGDRLRAAPTIADIVESDIELLEELREQRDEQLARVRERIAELFPEADVTSRLKTIQTIHEKLIREPGMDLARMADIAGVRIVRDMERSEQDRIVETLMSEWPGARVIDRRARPSHGYRAVHVVVKASGVEVEVQVRTLLQNLWAQAVERLGDAWGRQIKYGEPPNDPDRALGGNYTRGEAWGLWLELSEALAELETMGETVSALRSRAAAIPEGDDKAALLQTLDATDAKRLELRGRAMQNLETAAKSPELL